MKISRSSEDVLVTHALGSCLGLAAYDETAGVGGILHVMMPSSQINPVKAKDNPYMFVDTGVPAFFRELYACGCVKSRIVLTVAGGANVQDASDRFEIGKRNFIILRKLLWQNSVLIHSSEVGGAEARTLYLDMSDGRVWMHEQGAEKELYTGRANVA
jgi:chemotaxis protein CheD